MKRIIFRIRHFFAMCKLEARFGPFGKAPF
jgi:hypothetical protein